VHVELDDVWVLVVVEVDVEVVEEVVESVVLVKLVVVLVVEVVEGVVVVKEVKDVTWLGAGSEYANQIPPVPWPLVSPGLLSPLKW